MISHFMVSTRSTTSTAGISLPPVHGAQKGLDPSLKTEMQDKSKKVLLKPKVTTPISTNPRVVANTPTPTPTYT